MNANYLNFVMKLQESMLYHALPSDKVLHGKARQITVNDLSAAVEEMVIHLKPGIVMEIGAHGAEFSRSIKKSLPASRVIAFEANPNVHAKYVKDVSGAGVEYLFQCVADENRVYKFSVPGKDKEHSTMGSVLNYQPVDTYSTYDVEGKRLDDFLGRTKATNAMWVDVEGAVGSVLDGAEKSLKNCNLFFAELEATARWDGQILDTEVISRLAQYGLFPVLRDIQRHRWQHNILFLKQELLLDPVILRICSDFLRRTMVHVRDEGAKKFKAAAAASISLLEV